MGRAIFYKLDGTEVLLSPYQHWIDGGYPHTPDETENYPYQFIYMDGLNIYLVISPNAFTHHENIVWSAYPNRIYRYDISQWVYADYPPTISIAIDYTKIIYQNCEIGFTPM